MLQRHILAMARRGVEPRFGPILGVTANAAGQNQQDSGKDYEEDNRSPFHGHKSTAISATKTGPFRPSNRSEGPLFALSSREKCDKNGLFVYSFNNPMLPQVVDLFTLIETVAP
jgi:hypothetical protein